jgi:hypothetical protein
MFLLSLLLFAGASAPTLAQSPNGKLEQLVRAKGVPFKINKVSTEYLGSARQRFRSSSSRSPIKPATGIRPI